MAGDTAGSRDSIARRPGFLGLRRSLSQLAALNFFTYPSPKLRRCWAEAEPHEDAEAVTAGAERHSIRCEFIIPPQYNATAGIKLGACSYLDEPICEDTEEGYCAGPFAISYSRREIVTAIIYPEVTRDQLRLSPQFNIDQTYCARADLFWDVGGSGRQESIANAEREIVVSFRGVDAGEYAVDVEEPPHEGKGAKAEITGVVIGATIAVAIIACLLRKGKKKGAVKIHHLACTEGESSLDDLEQEDEDMRMEKDDGFEII